MPVCATQSYPARMDETTMENSIETYREQLNQVNTVLQSAGGSGQDELLQLKKDLEEVIQLTEESLLSLKKSQLIGLVEGDATDDCTVEDNGGSAPEGSVTLTMDEEYEAFKLMMSADLKDGVDAPAARNSSESGERMKAEDPVEEDGGDDNATNDVDVELQEELPGTKCSLMYSHEWGAQERHNAVILELEPSTGESNEIQVRVLFCNPTHQSMRPCPFFLGAKCRFSTEDCRFSHGHMVSLSALSEYNEPNFSSLEVGSGCLARYQANSLWYPAEIESVDRDRHKYTVQYESHSSSAELGPEDILPRASHYNVSSSEDDDEDDGGKDNPGGTSHLPSSSSGCSQPEALESEIPAVAWRTLPGVSLGSWEEHTRGIGSKLMAMMGYEYGKGLGKYSQGRTEIVEAVIMPQGRSLDHCMELKERKKCQVVGEKKSKGKGKRHRDRGRIKKVKEKKDVFAFINKELKGRKAKISDLLKQNFELVKTDKRDLGSLTKSSQSSKSSGRKINIQLVRTQEEMSSTKKEIIRLKQSMDRNEKDKRTRQQIEYQIQQKQNYLDSLAASEKKLERQQTSRNHHRKLTIF